MQPVAEAVAVDELGDAVTALVRAYRALGRQALELMHAPLPSLELVRLLGEGEHRLSEIAELRGVGQSVVSRQIAELEARRLVHRRPDPTDGRASLVSLTTEGRELLGRARELRRAWLRAALRAEDSEGAEDIRTAIRLVARLAARLESGAPDLAGLGLAPH